jgi:2-amino-4-hydroxy-6-hydroxymethyldihydropteridine diphosphokinase
VSQPRWYPAYIGIGSNLESPLEQARRGIEALRCIDQSLLVACSHLYRSKPVGIVDQPDFINAVATVLTRLDSHALLAALNAIEDDHGRVRTGQQWGPRTLDLDLLSYSSDILVDDVLTLPHPRIAERNFVLLPWQEIAPHYRIPGLATVAELAAKFESDDPDIEKLDAA